MEYKKKRNQRAFNIGGDRVRYALDKKLLTKMGWKSGDEIIQIPFAKNKLMLYNKSEGNKQEEEDMKLIAEQEFKRQNEFNKINKIPKTSLNYKRKIKKFNKGKTWEEDIPKLQTRFNREAKQEMKKKQLKVIKDK